MVNFTPRSIYALNINLGGPQGRSVSFLSLKGFEGRTVQPAAGRSTVYSTPALQNDVSGVKGEQISSKFNGNFKNVKDLPK
jgi:hypothetical protein